MNYRFSSSAGIPFAFVAALLPATFARRYEMHTPRDPR